MTPHGVAGVSLEFLVEPAVLMLRHGAVLKANAAARRMLSIEPTGHDLFDHVQSSHEELRTYLRRSSGSTAPQIGAVSLRTADGVARYRLYCAAVSGAAESPLILRCMPVHDERFAHLNRQVRQLNTDLRVRLREKALLEETLRHNEQLMRELQHRVKNNVQMMASLVQMSNLQTGNVECKRMLSSLQLKLQAMGSAQDALLRARRAGTVSVGALVHEIVTLIGESLEVASRLRVDAADVELSSEIAHPLALIVNELLTNAIKYGLDGTGGTVRVEFGPVDEGFELRVRDSGPGFSPADPGQESGSGLRLVRALCREIGGSVEIASDNGTTCCVRFGAG